MQRHASSLDPYSLRRLRGILQRLLEGRSRGVPVADLVALAGARLPGDLTIDLGAARELGVPLLVLAPRAAPWLARLTPRERQVATLIAAGLVNKEIAARLGLTVGTVKDYVHRLLRKTHLPNRAAVAAALTREFRGGGRTRRRARG